MNEGCHRAARLLCLSAWQKYFTCSCRSIKLSSGCDANRGSDVVSLMLPARLFTIFSNGWVHCRAGCKTPQLSSGSVHVDVEPFQSQQISESLRLYGSRDYICALFSFLRASSRSVLSSCLSAVSQLHPSPPVPSLACCHTRATSRSRLTDGCVPMAQAIRLGPYTIGALGCVSFLTFAVTF